MSLRPDDEERQDSSEIYDRLEARHPESPLFPATPLQRIASLLVALYSDQFATIPAMHDR
jgi:glutathione S-transferase